MSKKGIAKADKVAIKQLKGKLILANKVLDFLKMATPFGHISVRIPGTENFLIIGPIAPVMATMRDIVVCDMDGKVLQGRYKSTYSEVVIHTGVYKKRKEFNSVIHSHSPYTIALSIADLTVLPADVASIWAGSQPIALFKKVGYIDNPELGEEVADLLGPNKAVILKGHGSVVAGKNIEDAIFVARHLEISAMLQWMARGVGKVVPLTEQEIGPLNEYKNTIGNQPWMAADREWKYYEYLLKKGVFPKGKANR
jgi:ribulose-5-phosphate 4-epimerase/fuculose-1-phosphate aldolase